VDDGRNDRRFEEDASLIIIMVTLATVVRPKI
jgi:hypothetical protein